MSESTAAGALEAFQAYERNLRWAKTHDSELEKHVGKYVAVAGETVIAAAESAKDLPQSARKARGVYITFVVKRGLIWIL